MSARRESGKKWLSLGPRSPATPPALPSQTRRRDPERGMEGWVGAYLPVLRRQIDLVCLVQEPVVPRNAHLTPKRRSAVSQDAVPHLRRLRSGGEGVTVGRSLARHGPVSLGRVRTKSRVLEEQQEEKERGASLAGGAHRTDPPRSPRVPAVRFSFLAKSDCQFYGYPQTTSDISLLPTPPWYTADPHCCQRKLRLSRRRGPALLFFLAAF